MEVSEQVFSGIVSKAIDSIPEKYAKHIQNVAFIVEDIPSAEQREKLHLHNGQTLFGLYEGVPIPARASNYNLVLPDKITLFRLPLGQHSSSEEELEKLVQNTVWHEVAHYFGLDHDAIFRLENPSA